MRNTIFLVGLASVGMISGCTVPDDYAGDIVEYNGNMVVIEGMMNQPDGMDVKPTPGMIASASETCGGSARFVSWGDTGKPDNPLLLTDNMTIAYRFLCN